MGAEQAALLSYVHNKLGCKESQVKLSSLRIQRHFSPIFASYPTVLLIVATAPCRRTFLVNITRKGYDASLSSSDMLCGDFVGHYSCSVNSEVQDDGNSSVLKKS